MGRKGKKLHVRDCGITLRQWTTIKTNAFTITCFSIVFILKFYVTVLIINVITVDMLPTSATRLLCH